MARCIPGIASAVLLVFTASGNAASRELFPEAVGSQHLVYDAGTAWIVNPGAITAAVSFAPADSSSIWVGLIVRNDSAASITVREQDITANFGAAQLKVWSATELIAHQHRKENWHKLAANLAAGLNAFSAGQQGRYSTSGTFDGNIQSIGAGGYAQAQFNGTYSASGVDPVARQRAFESAARENQALMARVREQGELDEQSLNSFAFHSQTIPPGGGVSGHVKIDVPRASSTAKALVVMLKATTGATIPFFVGLDGSYNDDERTRAAQIFERVLPRESIVGAPQPALPGVSPAAAQPHESQPIAPAAEAAPPTRVTRQPNIGDKNYWPSRKIEARTPLALTPPQEPSYTESAAIVPAPRLAAPELDVIVSILGKRLEPCPSDMASTCVVIDISWQADSALPAGATRSGKLVFASVDATAAPLGISWNVPDGLAPGRKIEEHGIEFPLSKAGHAKQWLSTTDADSIRAKYLANGN